MKHTR